MPTQIPVKGHTLTGLYFASLAQSVEHAAVNRRVVGSSPTWGAKKEYSLSTVGVDDAGGPPVPIPNTEVKPCSAEDSALATGCENRKMPTLDSEYFFI